MLADIAIWKNTGGRILLKASATIYVQSPGEGLVGECVFRKSQQKLLIRGMVFFFCFFNLSDFVNHVTGHSCCPFCFGCWETQSQTRSPLLQELTSVLPGSPDSLWLLPTFSSCIFFVLLNCELKSFLTLGRVYSLKSYLTSVSYDFHLKRVEISSQQWYV